MGNSITNVDEAGFSGDLSRLSNKICGLHSGVYLTAVFPRAKIKNDVRFPPLAIAYTWNRPLG